MTIDPAQMLHGAQPTDTDKAAKALEAYFLRRVLAEVRGGGGDGLMSGGMAGGMFREMLDDALADQMAAAGGFGLAPTLAAEMGGKAPGAAHGSHLSMPAANIGPAPTRSLEMAAAPQGGAAAVGGAVVQLSAAPPASPAQLATNPRAAAARYAAIGGAQPAGRPLAISGAASAQQLAMQAPPAATGIPATEFSQVPGGLTAAGGRPIEPLAGSPLTVRPVPGGHTSHFGGRTDPIDHTPSHHPGLDLHGATGTPVRAAGVGKVVRAGVAGGYGNMVEIDHGNGLHTRYGHLSAISVKVGDTIDAGQLVGEVGATGRVTGPHLHFEVRRNGRAVDPEAEMPGL